MKPQELRSLDAGELTGQLKTARRELFELRFKLAVGQLENHREILKVRKDIARILTVIHEHRLGAGYAVPEDATTSAAAPARTASATAVAEREPESETKETPESVAADEAPAKKKRRTTAQKEETE